MLKYKYAVLGAGRQGIAAAYDLAKLGAAKEVLLVDNDLKAARTGTERINKLLQRKIAKAIRIDASNINRLKPILQGVDSFISALPFAYNLTLTKLAIQIKANMCDIGGETPLVRQQLKYNHQARKAGVSIVPDCGMGPGMNISLAVAAMSLVDKPREVSIWDGGLPQHPQPPWNYASTFHIDGLINEYTDKAYFLRNGNITRVNCFEDLEELYFPKPLGRLEAFVTSGGLSTAPWTFKGKLKRLENKTLRYPGHCAQFKSFAQLGLMENEPVKLGNLRIKPNDLFRELLIPKITQPQIRDVGIIRVRCIGYKNGKKTQAVIELIDYYDKTTGFTAMQRLTGWHASIVTILITQGKIPAGVISVENVPGHTIVKEARRRGFHIKTRITPLK